VVQSVDWHAQYGPLIEVDHGNGLTTRYAHVSRSLVQPGDNVRRAQPIAQVGISGRSTGPHLQFEALVAGVPHDPARFLAGGAALPTLARTDTRRRGRGPQAPGASAKLAGPCGRDRPCKPGGVTQRPSRRARMAFRARARHCRASGAPVHPIRDAACCQRS
jgi:hypothetical protein